MATTPTPLPTLADAITAVESADSAYNASVQTTSNDTATAAAIQSKLDAANQAVATDKQAQNTAAAARNTALDTLIAVAQASKLPV